MQNGGQIVRHTIVLLKNRAPLGGSEFYAFSNNNEKFTVTVNFIQIVGKLSEGHLNVSDHFGRFPKTTECFR